MIPNKFSYYLILFVFILFGTAAHAEEKQLVIAGRKIVLRARPSFLGKAVMQADYGAKVFFIKQEGSWYQVKLNTKEGWVHQSSVQDSYFILKDIGRGNAASKKTYKDEVVAAGKGFSPEYESMMKSKNPDLKYEIVNKIESWKISVEALSNFGKNGGLNSETLK